MKIRRETCIAFPMRLPSPGFTNNAFRPSRRPHNVFPGNPQPDPAEALLARLEGRLNSCHRASGRRENHALLFDEETAEAEIWQQEAINHTPLN
ncbi:hypothetical protein D3C72_359160 [compost metagenome]